MTILISILLGIAIKIAHEEWRRYQELQVIKKLIDSDDYKEITSKLDKINLDYEIEPRDEECKRHSWKGGDLCLRCGVER